MPSVIKGGRALDDPWRIVGADDIATPAPHGEHLILPLAAWLARLDVRHGVWLGPDDAPDALVPHLAGLPVVAIHFPVFTDGRGYSIARLLRGRHGYQGELRAFGDVLRDQLYFLHGSGFDAFQLRADQYVAEALAALDDYAWTPLGRR